MTLTSERCYFQGYPTLADGVEASLAGKGGAVIDPRVCPLWVPDDRPARVKLGQQCLPLTQPKTLLKSQHPARCFFISENFKRKGDRLFI
jgi:hypothetical protein